ncbi:hypothetical protein [Salinibacterium sp. PAMC 21357]|uniref:hypothetical protein n=1 Tax=Salinibacterium sp. PAMC 21357 TaxID=1112215 RepID=UPI000288585C|nr:hypothetical protein [Salinibacterium sp. PAMC 21357]
MLSAKSIRLLLPVAISKCGLRAIRFCDAEDGAGFACPDLYRHLHKPFGKRFELAVELPSPPDIVVWYALNRSKAMGEFSDRAVAVMNALSGHVAMHHRFALDVERSRLVNAEMDCYA